MPDLQYSQVPSVRYSHAIPTRAPIAKRPAFSPCFSTTPTTWCPGITGDLRGASSPSITCKSVRHTPQVRTRTNTSPSPGAGATTSANCRGFDSIGAGDCRTHAFISSPWPSLRGNALVPLGGPSRVQLLTFHCQQMYNQAVLRTTH